MDAPRPERSRVRQACEPCRRKKNKCPGERPACSYCTRLKQSCVYLVRDSVQGGEQTSRVAKTRTRSHRVQKLETQVNQMRQLLEVFINRDSSQSSAIDVAHIAALECETSPPSLSHHASPTDKARRYSCNTWVSRDPEPPSEVLDDFVTIYSMRIYFQPLPQFKPSDLRTSLMFWPCFLRYSFYALLLHYSDHAFYSGVKQEAIDFYTLSAQRSVDDFASRGIASIEVLHGLCLLSLLDILAKRAHAWINIGTATHLQALRRVAQPRRQGPGYDNEARLRCYWSVLLLEKTFMPQCTVLVQDASPPDWLGSPPKPQPQPICDRVKSKYVRNFTSFRDKYQGPDHGIHSYCTRATSIWGEILSFFQAVQAGKGERAWEPTSTFNQLTAKLYDLDIGITDNHALRLVSFHRRSPAQLQRDLEYWRPWIIVQFLFHSCQSALHHPFVHLLALRGNNQAAKAPSFFIQRTIDQALFHSAWVARLLDICDTVEFKIDDPLIGHLVASNITVLWIFQFAPDPSVSASAANNITKCVSFLNTLSVLWPHLGQFLESFKKLQDIASQARDDPTSGIAKITFQPQLLWTLLSPNISHIATANWSHNEALHVPEGDTKVTLHIDTSFVHPVAEDQPSQRDKNMAIPPVSSDEETATDAIPLELSLHSIIDDFYGIDLSAWQQFNVQGQALEESIFE